jgi:hypothetical protein
MTKLLATVSKDDVKLLTDIDRVALTTMWATLGWAPAEALLKTLIAKRKQMQHS